MQRWRRGRGAVAFGGGKHGDEQGLWFVEHSQISCGN